MITAGASGRPGGEGLNSMSGILSLLIYRLFPVSVFSFTMTKKFDGKNRKMTISFIDKSGSVWYNIFIVHIQKMC